MLNSTDYGNSTALKIKNAKKITTFLAFNIPEDAFIMLISDKMPTTVGILTFISMINVMLS